MDYYTYVLRMLFCFFLFVFQVFFSDIFVFFSVFYFIFSFVTFVLWIWIFSCFVHDFKIKAGVHWLLSSCLVWFLQGFCIEGGGDNFPGAGFLLPLGKTLIHWYYWVFQSIVWTPILNSLQKSKEYRSAKKNDVATFKTKN